MKTILHTFRTGGSPSGLSYYKGWAQCPRRATLDEAAKEVGAMGSVYGEAVDVGTIIHAYLEHYYGGGIPEDFVLEYGDDSGWLPSHEDEQKAQRVFKAYRACHTPDSFGQVVGVEMLIEEYPSVCEAVGIDPFTARIDMVTQVRTSEDQRRVLHQHGVEVEQGHWVVDHKTTGQAKSNTKTKWEESLQMTANCLAWNAFHPNMPVRGALINEIVTTKVPQFRTFVHRVDERKVKALHTFLAGIAHIKEHMPSWCCNDEYTCFFPRTCHWFEVGKCQRV